MFDLRRLSGQAPDEVIARELGAPLPEAGVIHVAAVGRSGPDRNAGLVVLKINQETPTSAFDNYLLNATRAWADVVLTSGAILRAEQELSFEIDGPNQACRERLGAWRGDGPPVEVAVLSSGRGIECGLQRLQNERPVTLFTTRSGENRSVPHQVMVVEEQPASPRSMVRWALRPRSGSVERRPESVESTARRVSVELGPSTSATLYKNPALIDRLLLSEFQGVVPPTVIGGPFLPGIDLTAEFLQLGRGLQIGEWRFRQFGRRSTSAPALNQS